MIKKLLFCLLVLTGAGMLNSCQQDEVVNEAPESKEILIRASLPSDEQSRVSFDDDKNGKMLLSWEIDDVITATRIDGNKESYQFVLSEIDGNTAVFTYEGNNVPTSGTFIFTYGEAPVIGEKQTGTIDGLKHHMATSQVEITDWNAVNVQFSTTVALVEIMLDDNDGNDKVGLVVGSQTTVHLYDASTGEQLAYATLKIPQDKKVYFALPSTVDNCDLLVMAEGGTMSHIVKVANPTTLEIGKYYRLNRAMTGLAIKNCGTSAKYVVDNGVAYVYGDGAIGDSGLDHMKGNSFTSAVILDGITSIGNYAFYQRTSLKNVTIPASVTSIGYGAFKQCANGCKIKVLNETPPRLVLNESNSYDNVFGNPTQHAYIIYVPATSEITYESAAGWINYKTNIQPIQ